MPRSDAIGDLPLARLVTRVNLERFETNTALARGCIVWATHVRAGRLGAAQSPGR